MGFAERKLIDESSGSTTVALFVHGVVSMEDSYDGCEETSPEQPVGDC